MKLKKKLRRFSLLKTLTRWAIAIIIALSPFFALSTPCFANNTVMIIIQPKQQKEFFIALNGITKTTIEQKATFHDVPDGEIEIEINSKKKIKKLITKSTKIQILYKDD